jgi:hypothetical protein
MSPSRFSTRRVWKGFRSGKGLDSRVPASNWPRLIKARIQGAKNSRSQECESAFGFLELAPGSRDLGAVAQLGERLICIQEVAGSIPTSSTSGKPLRSCGIRRRVVSTCPYGDRGEAG